MIFGYDFETTRIQEGTPDLLYITVFGMDYKLSMRLDQGDSDRRLLLLLQILENHLLIPEHNKAKFIAWNGNGYDVHFLVAALLKSKEWTLHPYMTSSKALRGLRVKSKRKYRINGKRLILQYEFLDGMSMTGITNKTLKQFLATFAPDLPKLELDLDKITFNPDDPVHVAYAERDSEALYVAMTRINEIIHELTGLRLKPTIGNIAINYFMDNVPKGVRLKKPSESVAEILHGPVKRGGYCWCMQQYTGPVWKYDINQAYAAAMRDAKLPADECVYTETYVNGMPGIYEVILSRDKLSPVPFYYKSDNDPVGKFTCGKDEVICWLTSIEIDHLRLDDWNVTVNGGYTWMDSFNWKNIIDELERLRATDKDGPSGSLGMMVKNIGNNAYGKTLEKLNGLELIISAEQPEGFDLYDPFDEIAQFIYCRSRPVFKKRHHLPQIGVFVTAHVRCKVRETALLAPEAFLYADTDCVVFSRPMDSYLTIDKVHYGDWKIEAENIPYIIIGKKIYHGEDGSTKAKALRTKELSREDYEKWLLGITPEQTQIQRNNLLKFLAGYAMFRKQDRNGTDVNNSKVYGLEDGRFIPK